MIELDDAIPDVWVISDTHFFHRNIVDYAGRHQALEALLGADEASHTDHTQYMAAAWRETVSDGDRVLHLGDLWLGSAAQIRELMPTLPGRIAMLRGNHDKRSATFYANLGITLLFPFNVTYGTWNVRFVHDPATAMLEPGETTLVVHGHTHNVDLPDPRYINCSVEQLGYRPTKLWDLIDARLARILGRVDAPPTLR